MCLKDCGDKLAVMLLKLDMLSSEPNLNVDNYQSGIFAVSMVRLWLNEIVLSRIIRSVLLTEANFKTYVIRLLI